MHKARLMIVEDNEIISMEMKQKLESAGYEVTTVVGSGEEAVTKAAEKIPDLILRDIKLRGDMDGIEAAEKIRYVRDIPIIYLTAYSESKIIKRAQATRPAGYLLKPIDEDELHSKIEISLRKYRN